MPVITLSRVVVKGNVIFFNLLSFSYETSKIQKMKVLTNLLTVDSDSANFPLHGGI